MKNDHLNLLALQDMAEGDLEYECEIIHDILNEGSLIFSELIDLQEKKDIKGISESVHRFKGCIAYVASDAIVAEFQKIENLGRVQNALPTKQNIENLEHLYLKVKVQLKDYLKEIS